MLHSGHWCVGIKETCWQIERSLTDRGFEGMRSTLKPDKPAQQVYRILAWKGVWKLSRSVTEGAGSWMRATFVTYIWFQFFKGKDWWQSQRKVRVLSWGMVARGCHGQCFEGTLQCLSHGQHRLKDTVFTLCLRLLQVRQGWSKAFQRKAWHKKASLEWLGLPQITKASLC